MNDLAPAPKSRTSVSLRTVEAADTPLLFAIYSSTRAEELAQVNWNDAQREGFLRMQFDAQSKYYASEYPGAEFQIILAASQPAGRLYLHRREREIRVMDIALLPEFRGRGIGTELLNDILVEARRTRRSVTIHVETFNPAQRLYARLGFRPIDTAGVYHMLEWSCGESQPETSTRSS